MVEASPATGCTVYLNAAVVPRCRAFPLPAAAGLPEPPEPRQPHESSDGSSMDAGDAGGGGSGAAAAGEQPQGGSSSSGGSGSADSIRGHHFLLVELQDQLVTAARDVWVGVHSSGGVRRCMRLQEQERIKDTFGVKLDRTRSPSRSC